MKLIAPVGIVLALGACATTTNDYDLGWDSTSAVLHVYSPEGDPVPAFGGQLLSVPGYQFSQGAVHMHPGEHVIGYWCPRKDGIEIVDAIPYVRFSFEAGHVYELRCKDGEPVIYRRSGGA
jgi:hypothetical protein